MEILYLILILSSIIFILLHIFLYPIFAQYILLRTLKKQDRTIGISNAIDSALKGDGFIYKNCTGRPILWWYSDCNIYKSNISKKTFFESLGKAIVMTYKEDVALTKKLFELKQDIKEWL